jgi:flagellar protein FlgJ
MADARTADSMAKTGSLGIAELLMSQFGGNKSAPVTAATATPDKTA